MGNCGHLSITKTICHCQETWSETVIGYMTVGLLITAVPILVVGGLVVLIPDNNMTWTEIFTLLKWVSGTASVIGGLIGAAEATKPATEKDMLQASKFILMLLVAYSGTKYFIGV